METIIRFCAYTHPIDRFGGIVFELSIRLYVQCVHAYARVSGQRHSLPGLQSTLVSLYVLCTVKLHVAFRRKSQLKTTM